MFEDIGRDEELDSLCVFVDPGGGHAHLPGNETTDPAETVAVQILPEGADRRIDILPAPVNC